MLISFFAKRFSYITSFNIDCQFFWTQLLDVQAVLNEGGKRFLLVYYLNTC